METNNVIINLNSNDIESILDKPILRKINDTININFLSKHVLKEVLLKNIYRIDNDLFSKKTIRVVIDITLKESSKINLNKFELTKDQSNVRSFIRFFEGRKGSRFMQVYFNFIYLDVNDKFINKKSGKATTSNDDEDDGGEKLEFN
jgi:hypothetical protein